MDLNWIDSTWYRFIDSSSVFWISTDTQINIKHNSCRKIKDKTDPLQPKFAGS